MVSPPDLLHDLSAYSEVAIPHIWAIATGGTFAVVIAVIRRSKTRLPRLAALLARDRRHWLSFAIILISVLYVSFEVFSDVNAQLQTAKTDLAKAQEKARLEYSYGLTIEDIVPSLDPDNETNTLEIRELLVNGTSDPLRYKIEKIVVILPGKTILIPSGYGIIQRQSQQLYFANAGLSRDEYRAMPDRVVGSVEISMIYGHPDKPYSRRLVEVIDLYLFKKPKTKTSPESLTRNWIYRVRTDDPID